MPLILIRTSSLLSKLLDKPHFLNEYVITSKQLDKKWITVDHIPETLAEILLSLMKTWKIYSTKAIISESHRAAPEGKWVPGGSTEIPFNYELFEPKIHTKFVREEKDNEC